MLKFTVKRFFSSVVVIFILSIISFFIFNIAPGDPATYMLGPSGTPKVTLQTRTWMGLNQPPIVRYFIWLNHFIHGDLGVSYMFNQPVSTVIKEYLPFSLVITGIAFILAIILALLIAVITAIKRKTLLDYLMSAFSLVGISIPDFWVGMMIVALFSHSIKLLPYIGLSKFFFQFNFLDKVKVSIFPILILTFLYLGSCIRYIRSSIQEVLEQDYIISARSRGISEKKIIFKHTLRNAVKPLITFIGYTIPTLISSSIVLERVFNCPGIGRIIMLANYSRDYPLLMGIMLITSSMVIISSFFADFCYALLDPRIRYD